MDASVRTGLTTQCRLVVLATVLDWSTSSFFTRMAFTQYKRVFSCHAWPIVFNAGHSGHEHTPL